MKPSRFRWWVEWPALVIIYEGFETLRDHAKGGAGAAQRNARWLVDLERWTWTLHEHPFNVFVAHHKTLAQAMDIYYGTIHFLIPPAILIWLWCKHPEIYKKWRNIIAAFTFASLLFFWQVPLAPPRLYPGTVQVSSTATCNQAIAQDHGSLHFVDTNACWGGLGPMDSGSLKDLNPYAAMPSLHMAWSTFSACAIIAGLGLETGRRRKLARRLRWLSLLYPLWTLSVVVGTANHWFGDAVGGWIFLAAGYGGVTWWMNRSSRAKDPPVALATS